MILFVSYSGALGGAERLLIDWARGGEREVCLACPEGPFADAARIAGLRVLPLRRRRLAVRGRPGDRFLSPIRLAEHGREVRALVAATGPELIVAWGMRSGLAWLLLPGRPRIPVVFQHNDFLPGPIIGRGVRAAASRADLVTVVSHAAARDLDPTGRLGGRLEVVHPGVDTKRFAAAGPPADPPEVLVLGAIVGWKRPDIALEAVALARRELPTLKLRLVGAVFDQELFRTLRIRACAPDLDGAVEFTGHVADPADDLLRATCLLHCAECEPFGLVVTEAMAAGRPVIAPAAGGPTEIVDSSCAVQYPPGDATAAARAVQGVVADPGLAASMGRAGRERARARFDLAASRERWGGAVRRLLAMTEPTLASPSLTIVTVTRNSSEVIGALLASVERHLPRAEVVVVDNASSDDTVATARACGDVRVIELGQNVGFGAATNRGVSAAGGTITALLNPDVELLDDSLLELAAEAARTDAGERLLAPRVIGSGGRVQDSVHPAPGSAAELARVIVPFTLLPWRWTRSLAPWRASAPQRVGWAIGCALIARTKTLRALGPFDASMFLYAEDLELGLRASEQGIETWYWPSVRVLHHGAHATRAAFGGEAFGLIARTRRDALAGRRGAGAVAVDDVAQMLSFAVRIAAKGLLGRDNRRERQQLRAVVAARREWR